MEPDAARALSDREARRVLAEAEVEHRRRDPSVRLRLDDYRVETRTRADAAGTVHEFEYVHANPDVPFLRWTGHPMHFTIRVGPAPDRLEVLAGE